MGTVKQGHPAMAVRVAAYRLGLSPRTIRRYIAAGLVPELSSEADLSTIRRIRELTELGINLAGVEAVLRMREQIINLQHQLASHDRNRRAEAPEAIDAHYRVVDQPGATACPMWVPAGVPQ